MPATTGTSTRRRRIAIAGAAGAAALLGAMITASAGAAGAEHKVTICHATDSYSNPYVAITVDYHSIVNGGHGGHEGPVFYPAIPKHTKWGDIIPAFDFGPNAAYAGMNLTADGALIAANGCHLIGDGTTTTTIGTTTTTIGGA